MTVATNAYTRSGPQSFGGIFSAFTKSKYSFEHWALSKQLFMGVQVARVVGMNQWAWHFIVISTPQGKNM